MHRASSVLPAPKSPDNNNQSPLFSRGAIHPAKRLTAEISGKANFTEIVAFPFFINVVVYGENYCRKG